MKTSLLVVVIFLAFSCIHEKKPLSDASSDSVSGQDSVIYMGLVASFDTQFSEIENEFESADELRKQELGYAYEALEMEMVEAQKKFIREHPEFPLCISILLEIDWSFSSASEFRSYLNLIDASLNQQADYLKLAAIVEQMEKVEIGKIAPDFEMNDTGGMSRRLSDRYQGSSYLLLDFWASHCGPCRIENVNIRKAYRRFHDQGFDVLGVSTDTRREHWISAIEMDSLDWTNVCSLEPWNENEVVRMYALRQVSQNFLLDDSGKIIATELRGEELLATLEELFK